jgi:hypothetical protein
MSTQTRRATTKGVAGFLDHVVLFDFEQFMREIESDTGNQVRLHQREVDGQRTSLAEAADGSDLLIVVSLDHMLTGQAPDEDEMAAIRKFLGREGATLVVCPHHDVGAADDQEAQLIEMRHHGDRLVPSQQRLGGYARALLDGIGLAVVPQFGLSPASDSRGEPAPLSYSPTSMSSACSTESRHSTPTAPRADRRGGPEATRAREATDPARRPNPSVH